MEHPDTAPTLADLLDAYTREYLPLKAHSTQYQEARMYRWLREELGHIPLASLSPLILRTWRDSLRTYYKPNSIRRYLTALSAALTVAVRDYAWIDKHPLRSVAKPPAPPSRERCLTSEELSRLLLACQRSRNPHLHRVVVLALATGTRKNELLQRQWSDVDLERRLLSLPWSKNGDRRAIPLVPHAWELLQQYAARSTSVWVFARQDGLKPVYIDYAWWTACDRAEILDFHFHDLRHTAASYLAMSGASIQEIAEILGHKSLNQTRKYIHLVEPHTRGVMERMADRFLIETPPSEAPAKPRGLEHWHPGTRIVVLVGLWAQLLDLLAGLWL